MDLFKWKPAQMTSIQWKIYGLIAVIVLTITVVSIVWVRAALTNALSLQVEDRARAIGADLASRSVDFTLTHDIFALDRLVEDTMKHYEDIAYIFIKDDKGHVLVVSNKERSISRGLSEANFSMETDSFRQANAKLLETDMGRVVDVASPILQKTGGEVRMGMRFDGMRRMIDTVITQMMLVMCMVFLLAVLFAFFSMNVLLNPIKELALLTKAVAAGDLEKRAAVNGCDEIGQLARSFNSMLERLKTANMEKARQEQIRRMLMAKLIRVQEEERKRIARELHDETGHALTAMLMELSFLKDAGDITSAQERHLQKLKEMIDRTLAEVHVLTQNLRPNILDKFGLQAALEGYVEELRGRHGFSVDLVINGRLSYLRSEVEVAIYRLVQESLTNIIRYAKARSVSIILMVNETFSSVVVEDDGVGFDPSAMQSCDWAKKHLGLLGMKERISLLNGVCEIESKVGGGTAVLAKIPHQAGTIGGERNV